MLLSSAHFYELCPNISTNPEDGLAGKASLCATSLEMYILPLACALWGLELCQGPVEGIITLPNFRLCAMSDVSQINNRQSLQ